jgi:hypothetical protein
MCDGRKLWHARRINNVDTCFGGNPKREHLKGLEENVKTILKGVLKEQVCKM